MNDSPFVLLIFWFKDTIAVLGGKYFASPVNDFKLTSVAFTNNELLL